MGREGGQRAREAVRSGAVQRRGHNSHENKRHTDQGGQATTAADGAAALAMALRWPWRRAFGAATTAAGASEVERLVALCGGGREQRTELPEAQRAVPICIVRRHRVGHLQQEWVGRRWAGGSAGSTGDDCGTARRRCGRRSRQQGCPAVPSCRLLGAPPCHSQSAPAARGSGLAGWWKTAGAAGPPGTPGRRCRRRRCGRQLQGGMGAQGAIGYGCGPADRRATSQHRQ